MSNPSAPATATARRRDRRSVLAWLLAVPLLLVLYPPLYNRVDPTLLGIPFFYWYQLAVIPVSVICTAVVYRATTPRDEPQGGNDPGHGTDPLSGKDSRR